jgi:hypothetical protein
MKTTALAVLGLVLPGMALAQSATFDVNGLPVSLHQAQVLAVPNLHEQPAAPVAQRRDGFAESPVQALLLRPRDATEYEDTVAHEEIARTLHAPVSASSH